MGCFSWMFSNCNNKRLRIGREAYVPMPNGEILHEECYEGYGEFAGHDIYDLVADWNKELIDLSNLRPMSTRDRYQDWPEGDQCYICGIEHYMKKCQRLLDFKTLSDEEMLEKYGRDWKRSIGIDIACFDDQNAALKYPIKVTSKPIPYDKALPSNSDPDQGF